MLYHRQLADDQLAALVDKACTEVTRRTTHRAADDSIVAEIINRRLATHVAIASVLADIRMEPDRATLLEPLRGALRREVRWLLSTRPGHVDAEASSDLLREVDDVASPDSIDCLMVAAGHDIALARSVLSEALATILDRVESITVPGPSSHSVAERHQRRTTSTVAIALGVFAEGGADVSD